jgi:hypothetical protein
LSFRSAAEESAVAFQSGAKILLGKEENLRHRKSVRPNSTNHHEFTTTSPRFTIQKTPKNTKTPPKTPLHHVKKKYSAKSRKNQSDKLE